MLQKIIENRKTIAEIVILIGIVLFLFTYFKPNLLFSDTHISAGDTVGHYYPMYYLNKVMIPQGEIIGWCPQWFLGYPMFQFYFPMVFTIGALLGYFVQLPIAFKIITVLGTFLLPICVFISMKIMKFEFPLPIIGAIFTLPFLFLENYSMWGGNIPSTLAGEFAYVFSLSIMMVLIGCLYTGVKENKFIALNGILFAITMISHIFPAMFAMGLSVFFLLDRKNFRKNLIYLIKTFGLGLLLAGFWFIPMLAKSAYTVPHMWYLPSSLEELGKMLFVSDPGKFFPLPLFGILAIAGLAIGLWKKEDKIRYFAFAFAIAFAGLIVSGNLTSLNISLFKQFQFIKFIPIMYLFIFLTGSYIFSLALKMKGKILIAIIALIIMVLYINSGVTYIAYWIDWNYTGYENKSLWPAYENANNFLATLPYGRAVFEYDPDRYDSGLGSSRATETIPAFSGQPITEGTHFQSAFNGPYIYFAHCEYSNGCSCVFGPETNGCTGFDMDAATEHFNVFNVKYLFVSSDKLKNALRERYDYKMLYGPAEFEIWEFTSNNGKYATLAKYQPVQVTSKDWREISYRWFREYQYDDILLVWESKPDNTFRYIVDNVTDFSTLPKENVTDNCFIDENFNRKELDIHTSCIGKPIIVKISYFPNWQVEGASKIYMVSPALMLIYPDQANVRIYYGMTWSDIIGNLATLSGFVIIAAWFFISRKNKNAKRYANLLKKKK